MSNEFSWGERSIEALSTVSAPLVVVANAVLARSRIDFAILWGYRDKAQQTKFFNNGTGLPYGKSKHNRVNMVSGEPESYAIDFAPVPIVWDKIEDFYYIGGLFLRTGHELGVPLIWGGHWDKRDLGHIERRD